MGFTPKILFDEITDLKHKKDLRESQTYQIRDSIKKLQDELKKNNEIEGKKEDEIRWQLKNYREQQITTDNEIDEITEQISIQESQIQKNEKLICHDCGEC